MGLSIAYDDEICLKPIALAHAAAQKLVCTCVCVSERQLVRSALDGDGGCHGQQPKGTPGLLVMAHSGPACGLEGSVEGVYKDYKA